MDRISSVPDDILILVVSRLPLEEAARTSLLSRRWRHLWTHSRRLYFDDSKSSGPPLARDRLRLRLQYMDMVDQVIAASQAPALDCFRVRFSLDSPQHSEKIDRWINFAMSRKAQELELFYRPLALLGRRLYKFPSPTYTHGFEVLKSLRLFNIEIAPKDLTCLLAKCVLLEELDIQHSRTPTDLKIAPGPPLRLRRLILFPAFGRCQTITIAAPTPDLTSLVFRQPLNTFHIQYAPKLSDLHVSATDDPSLVFHHLRSYLSQIQTLSLTLLSAGGWRKLMRAMPLLPDMTCLKHLTLGVESFSCIIRLSVLTSLITKSPSLQHLTIKIIGPQLQQSQRRLPLNARPFRKGCHPSLQVIELRGFEGSKNDIELALHLLSTAGSLEKLILDLRDPYMESDYAFLDPRKLGGVVNRALELRGLMPPQVHLMIVKLVDDHGASYREDGVCSGTTVDVLPV